MNALNSKCDLARKPFKDVYSRLTQRNKNQLGYLWGLKRCESSKRGYRFEVTCDCGDTEVFTHSEEVCYFIFAHAGHEIWIDTKKKNW